MDNSLNENEQEQMRSFLMGWKQKLGTASIYNRRFIENNAGEVLLKMQNDMINIGGD